MKRYIEHIIRGAELRTERFLEEQDRNPESLQYGGIRGDIVDVKPTVYALGSAVAVYLNQASRFYRSEPLLRAVNLALDFIARMQREDGSFDFPSCNFRSAPDTSFCFKRLIAVYRLLTKYDDGSAEIQVLRGKYLALIHAALEGIRDGGFHTPNHRWAIAAALLQGANLFADEAAFAQGLRARAEQYLAEGIDGDEDGEYAERSTGNYNAVVNNAMITLFQETGDERFLGYVRRNLEMMLCYIDPDGTIFTQNSTRQDKGKAEYADKYFYQYLFICSYEENARFDAAAHRIIRDNLERGDLAPDCLHILMRHDALASHNFTHCGFPETYRRFFRHAGVLRVKKERYAYTVLNGKSAFLFFKTGSMGLCVKIGESYCDIRNFVPQTIEVKEQAGCTLRGTARGWYYLPFETPQGTSDWWQMDHSKREKLISSELKLELSIEELADGLRLHLHTDGLDRLPLRLEVCVPAETVLENEHLRLKAAAGEGMILKDGCLEVRQAAQLPGQGHAADAQRAVLIGPGFGEHSFQGHYSGEEKNTAGYTVYCNAYTPVDRVFEIRVSE